MKKSRLFQVMIISLIILAITTGVSSFLTKEQRINNRNVRIEDLVICSGFDPVSGKPQEITSPIRTNLEHIYLCGYVVSEFPVELNIYLVREPEIKAVFHVPPDDLFEMGYFIREIILPTGDPVGHYRINIFLFRVIIASEEFEINE